MTLPGAVLRSGLFAALTLGLLSMMAPDASAAIFEIQKVTCVKASESDGDELRVRISLDGKSEIELARTMKTGQVWNINRKMEFKSKAQVRLVEHDPLLPDENLGTKFTNPVTATGAWVFSAHGATYYVHFNVSNGNNGFVLRLHSLKAIRTQEGNGDDIYLKTYRDNASSRTATRTMHPGQVWNLKMDLHFFNRAAVSFHEDDPLNPDDQLGGIGVTAPTGGVRTTTLIRNGMTYVLTYQVLRKDVFGAPVP